MPEPPTTPKRRWLRQQGTLHPRPQEVTHKLFRSSDFFDAEDLIQVKYEMLRQVQVDQQPVRPTAQAFGLSPPSFYQAQAAFQQSGLAGLLPQKRGPRGGHKLTAEVMEFVAQIRGPDPSISTPQLARRVFERFGISVHPRSIDRQWRRQKKR